jgi:hypothetical protein
MSASEATPAPSTPPSRLEGWKEISGYLNRSVRTAYRWERDLGLPVRRLGTGKGEVVFAIPAELDAWRQRLEVTSHDHALSAGSGSIGLAGANLNLRQAPGDAPPSRSQGAVGRAWTRNRQWIRWVALVAAGPLVLLVGYWGGRSLATASEGAHWRVVNGQLEVSDADQRVLWRHLFETRLLDSLYAQRLADHARDGVFDDLNGDGRQELLFLANPGTPRSEGLYCFDSRGQVVFHHQPKRTVRYGVQTYAGSWRPEHVFVTVDGSGRKRVWLVSTHYQEFPCVLEKLDATGNLLGEYWSDGYIESLAQSEITGRRAILVGAVNNEYRGASLAVLDEDQPTGSSPAMSPKYSCQDCPPGRPSQFLVLPRTDVAVATGGQAAVKQIIVDRSGQVRLEVLQDAGLAWEQSGGIGPNVFYLLSRDLRVIDAEFGDTYQAAHQMLERRRLLDRPFVNNHRLLFPILRWTGSRFLEITGPEVAK